MKICGEPLLGVARLRTRREGSTRSEIAPKPDPVPSNVPRRVVSDEVVLESCVWQERRRSDVDVLTVGQRLRTVRLEIHDVHVIAHEVLSFLSR
jgi:hypothetical protein